MVLCFTRQTLPRFGRGFSSGLGSGDGGGETTILVASSIFNGIHPIYSSFFS